MTKRRIRKAIAEVENLADRQFAPKRMGKREKARESRRLRLIDGRSEVALRLREITRAVVADQGGVENLTQVRMQLTKRFVMASVLAEQRENEYAAGKTIDLTEYALLTNMCARTAREIGVDRRARNINPPPTLAEIAHEIDAERDG